MYDRKTAAFWHYQRHSTIGNRGFKAQYPLKQTFLSEIYYLKVFFLIWDNLSSMENFTLFWRICTVIRRPTFDFAPKSPTCSQFAATPVIFTTQLDPVSQSTWRKIGARKISKFKKFIRRRKQMWNKKEPLNLIAFCVAPSNVAGCTHQR